MKIQQSTVLFSLSALIILVPGCSSITTKQNAVFDVVSSPVSTTPSLHASASNVKLPEPKLKGEVSLEETLFQRRSIREYRDSPLQLDEISQLLWAAQGITDASGGRTAPSAGALYPLEIYLVAGNVDNMEEGVYKYVPESHELITIKKGEIREKLASAALGQTFIGDAAVIIVITAVYDRTTVKYGDRGIRYVHMEAGHAAQNVLLQATALDLGAVPVGAFYDDAVSQLLTIPDDETPLYLIPVGTKR